MFVPIVWRKDLKGKEETDHKISIVLFPFIAQMLPKILSKFAAASNLRISQHSQI